MYTPFAIPYCIFILYYRIPFAFILYISSRLFKQSRTPPNLRQRLFATITRTAVETLPLSIVRLLFYLTGIIEQALYGFYSGKQRNQWCRRLDGEDWKGYLIGEDAATADVGEGADLVILYAHGGAYNIGGALISLVVFVDWIKTWKSSHGVKTHILSLEYGLAPEHPFPSARDSMLKCYQWLVNTKGLSPSKITFAGDSAGGNLSLVAALELINHPASYNAPPPSGLLLISPWLSMLSGSKTFKSNYNYDFISKYFLDLCQANYIGDSNLCNTCPLLSPLFERNYRGLPRTWVCIGSYEVLHDDVSSFVYNAIDQGISVDFVVEENNVHNYAIIKPLSRDGGAQKAAKHMGKFLFGKREN